jgi:lysophospholipase L1-like esterase
MLIKSAGLFTLLTLILLFFTSDALAAKPFCGDNKCSGKESQSSCPADCGEASECGDNVCDPSESCSSCASDCDVCPPASCNNDGVCNQGEDCLGCSDCPGKTSGKRKNRYCCGADTCDTGQCGANACSVTPVCGNGILEYNEECDYADPNSGSNCDLSCHIIPTAETVPVNQFNVGDSIGEGEAADGTIGAANHDTVWSTGYDGGDIVNSMNERFEGLDAAAYTENNASRDGAFNQAVSGAVMADFADQANAVATQAANVPPGTVGLVSILLGNNDVCAPSLSAMTDTALFESQYRAGLDVLASSPIPELVNLHISGIPDIYWLWNAKRGNFWCRVFAWPFVPCQNLLENGADDCASDASREDPDTVYPGDGENCQRRKAFHSRIKYEYNPILSDVLAEYQSNDMLLNAEYIDIFDVRFGSNHVNGGDCFHPSTAGHALMAEKQWCRSRWGTDDPQCTP